MINSKSNNIKSNDCFCLPKWFTEWFIIISKLQTDVSRDIEYCLERWWIVSAIDRFEKETIENTNKVWH